MLDKNMLFCFLNQFCVVLSMLNTTAVKLSEVKMEKCIINILSSKSLRGSDLVIINNDMVTNGLIQKIHGIINVKLYVKDYNVSVSATANAYMIYVQDLFNFEDLIDNLDKDWYRKPEALYIVILKDNEKGIVSSIFKTLWKHHIIHVLFIIYGLKDNGSIYTYYPYAEGRCGRDHSNVVRLSECENIRDFDVIEILSKFDKPVLKNCTMQVGTNIIPPYVSSAHSATNPFIVGIERFLLELLFQRENISLSYTYFTESLEFGRILDNFTVTGKIGKLYANEIEVLYGGFVLNHQRVIFFDFVSSPITLQDKFITIIPNAGLVEKWKIVYLMFDWAVWLLLLFVLLICAVFLSGVNNFVTVQKNFVSELFKLFGSATQYKSLILRNKIYQDLIIIHWLLFIFLINCFYQTKLTSFATNRSYKSQINDHSSLQAYNLRPILTRDVLRFFNITGEISNMIKHYTTVDICDTVDDCLWDVANNNSKYSVILHLRVLWWMANHPQEKQRIHIMKETFSNTLYGLFFKRGFPLLREFDEKMLRIIESGLLQAVKGFHNINRESKSANEAMKSFQRSTLQLEDLIIPLGLLLLGEVLSVLIFIIEIVYKSNLSFSAMIILYL